MNKNMILEVQTSKEDTHGKQNSLLRDGFHS